MPFSIRANGKQEKTNNIAKGYSILGGASNIFSKFPTQKHREHFSKLDDGFHFQV